MGLITPRIAFPFRSCPFLNIILDYGGLGGRCKRPERHIWVCVASGKYSMNDSDDKPPPLLWEQFGGTCSIPPMINGCFSVCHTVAIQWSLIRHRPLDLATKYVSTHPPVKIVKGRSMKCMSQPVSAPKTSKCCIHLNHSNSFVEFTKCLAASNMFVGTKIEPHSMPSHKFLKILQCLTDSTQKIV